MATDSGTCFQCCKGECKDRLIIFAYIICKVMTHADCLGQYILYRSLCGDCSICSVALTHEAMSDAVFRIGNRLPSGAVEHRCTRRQAIPTTNCDKTCRYIGQVWHVKACCQGEYCCSSMLHVTADIQAGLASCECCTPSCLWNRIYSLDWICEGFKDGFQDVCGGGRQYCGVDNVGAYGTTFASIWRCRPGLPLWNNRRTHS